MERFADGVVGVVQWLIDGIGYLGMPAQTAGEVLTILLIIGLPGFATYGVARLMSGGTAKSFGWFDALLTMLVVAASLGFVFGLLFLSSVSQGSTALAVTVVLLVSTCVGFVTGSKKALGWKPALATMGALPLFALGALIMLLSA